MKTTQAAKFEEGMDGGSFRFITGKRIWKGFLRVLYTVESEIPEGTTKKASRNKWT